MNIIKVDTNQKCVYCDEIASFQCILNKSELDEINNKNYFSKAMDKAVIYFCREKRCKGYIYNLKGRLKIVEKYKDILDFCLKYLGYKQDYFVNSMFLRMTKFCIPPSEKQLKILDEKRLEFNNFSVNGLVELTRYKDRTNILLHKPFLSKYHLFLLRDLLNTFKRTGNLTDNRKKLIDNIWDKYYIKLLAEGLEK